RLEDAEVEARNLQRRMPKALLLGEGEATEQRVKQLHRPALLHIVGHGIVRGNADCQAAAASPDCELAGLDPATRVMSLSAIVLEEAYGRGAAPRRTACSRPWNCKRSTCKAQRCWFSRSAGWPMACLLPEKV